MNKAKAAIFRRLRQARAGESVSPPDLGVMRETTFGDAAGKFRRFTEMMTAVNGEVHETTKTDWPVRLRTILRERKIATLAYGPRGPAGETIRGLSNAVKLLAFDKKVELLKERMFSVQAGFTTTHGGIAETGSLILRPGPDEPRQLSLVPPIHIALLDVDRLFDTFWQAQTEEPEFWIQDMPTNAILISGPSKTADIEQTLTYGVHGPKSLIVLAAANGSS